MTHRREGIHEVGILGCVFAFASSRTAAQRHPEWMAVDVAGPPDPARYTLTVNGVTQPGG